MSDGDAETAARKRGAQAGHQGTHRELLPEGKVNKFVDRFPKACENCWKPLPRVLVLDPSAKRYQQTEVPPIQPLTAEWRRHEVTCPCCKYRTRAPYVDDEIPASPFGPRLMAFVALLTGGWCSAHRSRRLRSCGARSRQ